MLAQLLVFVLGEECHPHLFRVVDFGDPSVLSRPNVFPIYWEQGPYVQDLPSVILSEKGLAIGGFADKLYDLLQFWG